jgi:hypothetical protein
MLTKLLANILIVAVLVLCNIGVMIYGWGLTPRSWWWIVGVGFFVTVFVNVIWEFLKKERAKEGEG